MDHNGLNITIAVQLSESVFMDLGPFYGPFGDLGSVLSVFLQKVFFFQNLLPTKEMTFFFLQEAFNGKFFHGLFLTKT